MKIETLDDLFRRELCELRAEQELLFKALPGIISACSSGRLREAFEQHLEQTRGHLRSLAECFDDLGERPSTAKAAAMRALIADSRRIAGEITQSPLRDEALIGVARRIQHHEIAACSAAISCANRLEHRRIAELLERILREEQAIDEKLSGISDSTVVQEALQLGAHQRG